ncbi:unnamed protein product [Mytilus edulis]|uniref:WSC domain-containing protein n=1 Tax=Mytilus edulis TaxID=6550 RepID=A0A8S3QZC8_MYTED|nr:unnamed protein product [Mytilus edulis]
MPYGKLVLPGNMTNDLCLSNCCSYPYLENVTFMGTEGWRECYCTNISNSETLIRRDETYCNRPCEGNQNELCGGHWSLSVYRIDCVTEMTTTSTVTDSGRSDNSSCNCGYCPQKDNTYWTDTTLAERLVLLKNAIYVNKKETTLYMSTKGCADDSRKSAQYLGLGGLIVILFPIIFVISVDILNFLKWLNDGSV